MGFWAVNLVNDFTYRPVYNAYREKYGKAEAEHVWRRAGERYEEMLTSYREKPFAFRIEVRGTLLKGIAIYKTIKARHITKGRDEAEALKFMEDGLKETAKKKREKMKKLFTKKIRRRIYTFFYIMKWKYFKNSECGYSHDGIQHDFMRKKMRVKIYGCPYRDCCSTESVRELTQVFCDYQKAIYTNVTNLTYRCSQVKGEANDMKSCDLYFGIYQSIESEYQKQRKKEQKEKRLEKLKKIFFFI